MGVSAHNDVRHGKRMNESAIKIDFARVAPSLTEDGERRDS